MRRLDAWGIDIASHYAPHGAHGKPSGALAAQMQWIEMRPTTWHKRRSRGRRYWPPRCLEVAAGAAKAAVPSSHDDGVITECAHKELMPPIPYIAIALNAVERKRAQEMVQKGLVMLPNRPAATTSAASGLLPLSVRREAARLLVFGYKYELEALGNIPLARLLPDPPA